MQFHEQKRAPIIIIVKAYIPPQNPCLITILIITVRRLRCIYSEDICETKHSNSILGTSEKKSIFLNEYVI